MNNLSIRVKYSKSIFSANDYQVMVVKPIEVLKGNTDKTSFQLAGSLPKLSKNEEIIVDGYFKKHKKYGEQFEVKSWNRPIPTSKNQAIQFLCSNIFKGIGKKTATKIVESLGEQAITLITHKGESALKKVEGLSSEKIQEIVENTRRTFVLNDILTFYAQYGITTETILKAYAQLQNGVIELKENPYLLAQLNLVDFYSVDKIAKEMNVLPHAFNRLETVLKIGLKEIGTRYGHCYIYENELLEKSIFTLNNRSSKEDYVHPNSFIAVLEQSKSCYIENGRVYPTNIYYAEKEAAYYLHQLTIGKEEVDNKEIEKAIKESNLFLSTEQTEAVYRLMKENVLVLTGGPGTGKTYTTNAIKKIYQCLFPDKKIALTAPTGRAARKIGEVTGLGSEAVTMHRLLGYGQNGYERPLYDNENPLEADLIIADEFSMVDIELARNLFKAIRSGSKLVLVGDPDQLPSVGVGNVLKDILETNIPQIKLSLIFRQAKDSKIIDSAHKINQGEMIDLVNTKEQFFIESKDSYYGNEIIVRSVQKFLKQGYDINDIMVLAPMKKGVMGVEHLNERIRDAINPAHPQKKEVKYLNQLFRKGDKIMYLRNNRDLDIYNGDIGIISKINISTNTIFADFEGVEVALEKDQWKYLQLAYCSTTHKAQGGQARIVILALSDEHDIMLTRNLFYTAITRAEEIFVLVGTKNAVKKATENNRVTKRNTSLIEKIMKHREHVKLKQAI